MSRMLVRTRPGGLRIVGVFRSQNTGLMDLSTTSTFTVALPAGILAGDLLVCHMAFGSTGGVTLNPTVPSGFTSLRTYSPTNTGWCIRTFRGSVTAGMVSAGTMSIPANLPSAGTTTGGMQVHVVALRGHDTSAPILSTTAPTGLPATGAAATWPFPSVTPSKPGCAVLWFGAGYLASAASNDGSWSNGLELGDTLGPVVNSNNGTGHVFTAGAVLSDASATGAVTLTAGSSRQVRDGAIVVVNPAPV